VPQQTTTTTSLNLSFVSQTHQALGAGCYNAQVTIILSMNSTGPVSVALGNFWLYANGNNLVITNSTYYAHPANNLRTLVLFPQVPINLVLYFQNFCLPQGITNPQVFLFYFDGTNTLKAQVF
jgi:hypothetical protein